VGYSPLMWRRSKLEELLKEKALVANDARPKEVAEQFWCYKLALVSNINRSFTHQFYQ